MRRSITLPVLTLIVLGGLLGSACQSTKACNAGTVMVTVSFDATTRAADAVDVYASVDASVSTMTTLAHGAGASEGSIELYFPNFGGYPTGKRLDVTVVARLGAATLASASSSILMLPDGCGTMTIALVGNRGPGTGGATGGAGTTGAAGRGGTTGGAGTTGAAGRGGTTGTAGTTGAAGATGAAGTTGGAGTTGAAGRGGTTGGAGTTGTGGVGGCAACTTGQTCVSNVCMNLNCTAGATVAPVSALITDFSDAVPDPSAPGQFRYGGGMLNRVQGGTALFQNPASPKGTLALSNNALTFTATTSAPISTVGADQYPYNGFAVYVDGPACVDASAYSRVSFILTGNLGTCNLQFSFAYSEILSNGVDPERGVCTAMTCFSSQYVITTSVTSVAFNATPTIAGSPVAAADKAKLTGVQFELVPSGTTGCIGTVTVTNIRFQ